MKFTSPASLLWLLPIGGMIVLMYILKLRRRDVVVSSTFLWSQVIRDVQANAPFQKLRKSLLLLLQLIAASLLILALARPFFNAYAMGGRNVVLIVDTSASMRATDVAPSRLDAARRIAHDLVGRMRPGDKMMILSASSRPKAASGFTSERSELHRAVDGLSPDDTPTEMRDAVNLAADLVASRGGESVGQIDLISDGGFEGTAGTDRAGEVTLTGLRLGRAHLTYHPVGVRHENVGITAIDFRRNLGERKTVQLLVRVSNYGTRERRFNEEIYADNTLVEAHEILLPAGGENVEPYDLPEPDTPRRMRIRLDLKDDLDVDNEASLVLKPRKTVKVLLAGRENLFLEKALKVDPAVDLSTIRTLPSHAAMAGFDVVVFSESAPAALPEGNYLFLHCVSDQAPVSLRGTIRNVSPADWEQDHPVLRYVDFGGDRFGSALKAVTLPWARELAVAESGSLIAAGERGRTRSVFFGFSLQESLFPLRVAFPILIANSIRWLGSGSDDSELGQIRTGSPITIPAAPAVGKVIVTRPDGSTREIAVGERGGAHFDETSQSGFYTATGRNFLYTFAANLSSPSESDITPRRSLGILDNPAAAAGRHIPNPRELLPLLGLLALAVLAAEWWVFHRRVHLA